MRFKNLELNGYKRFGLGGINYFKMVMTAPTQLILGTNGSGKSSLMEQISVLPATPADFNKGGGKRQTVEHRNSLYELESDFSKSEPHSFVFNGQQLNDGGTITVQRTLVKQHFGINQDIQDMIQGKEAFTSMSANRRKEWFISLCDTNYDFAISVYNKLRERHRDISGALKISKATLVQESEKLIQEETINQLKQDIKTLHEFLTTLVEVRRPVENDVSSLMSAHRSLDADLLQCAKALEQVAEKAKSCHRTIEQYKADIDKAQEQVVAWSALIENSAQRYQKNEAQIKILQQADQHSISELQDMVEQAHGRVAALRESYLGVATIEDPAAALTAFKAISPSLVAIFTEIPLNPMQDNGVRKYAYDALVESRNKLANNKLSQNNLRNEIHRCATKAEHMLKHKEKPDLSCPKCQHSFSMHYDERAYNGFLGSQAENEKALAALIEQEAELVKYVEECSAYGVMARQFAGLFQNNPGLSYYSNWLKQQGYLEDNPRAGVYILTEVETDLRKRVEVDALTKMIAEKTHLLSLLKNIGSADLTSLLEANQKLDDEMANLTKQVSQANLNKRQAALEMGILTDLAEYETQLRKIMREKKAVSKETTESIRRSAFNEMIRQVQSDLGEKERVVGTASLQIEVVRNLSEQIQKLTLEEQDISILIKRLSPTEGLIAEGLLGFIKNFIDQMNSIIAKIWSYDMVIQTCDVVEGDAIDVDYKFPMKIHTQEKPVPDVSKGSTGQLEIINLAYRLTAMHYLGMHDYPLYLDEAGSAFDPAHRAEFARMLVTIVEQSTFPQIFMISHYFDVYGGLNNVEACVLSTLNISPPVVYNKHVIIQ